MNNSFIIVGTDTNVGKTLLSSLLMTVFDDLYYWKPIQSGLEEETDSQTIKRLSDCSDERILSEAYRLQKPLSPHLSAFLENKEIVIDSLAKPNTKNLIIETAGGVLTPINRDTLQIDVIKMWGLPVVIAVRSSLGTINHSLLSIEALRMRGIDIAGVVMIGVNNPDNEEAIKYYGKVDIVGRIPFLQDMGREALLTVYQEHFSPFENIIASY